MPYKTGSWGKQAKARSKKRLEYFLKRNHKKQPRKFNDEELKEFRKNVGKRLNRGKGTPRPELSGENHWQWKGGKTKKRPHYNNCKYRNWRRAVFKRDKYTCQDCGIKTYKGLGKTIRLEAHHKKSWKKYPNFRFNIDNGITLCVKCHRLTREKKGG